MRFFAAIALLLISSPAFAGCDFYGECHEDIKPTSFNGEPIAEKPQSTEENPVDTIPPQPEPAKDVDATVRLKPVKVTGHITGNIGGERTGFQEEKARSEGTIGMAK